MGDQKYHDSINELRKECRISDWEIPHPNEPYKIILASFIRENQYFEEGEFESIDDVWNLIMEGDNRLNVEHEYQFLTNGPEVTECSLDGIYLERPNGIICNLRTNCDDNPTKQNNYPASQLPEDAVLVVRVGIIRDLMNRLSSRVDDNGDDFQVVDYTSVSIQVLADKAAAQYKRNKHRLPNKDQIANILFDGGLITKKHGDIAPINYIKRRFKNTWEN